MTLAKMLGAIGLPGSKYYNWKRRFGQANQHNGHVPRDFWLEDWEKKAIIQYTYSGQRKQLIAEGRVKEDGVYVLPGKFEKRSFVLLAFFLFQFLLLYYIAV